MRVGGCTWMCHLVNKRHAVQGEPFKALWFSMDCHDDAVQRLHYSTAAQLLTALARDAGYQPVNYTLPPLNECAPLKPVNPKILIL